MNYILILFDNRLYEDLQSVLQTGQSNTQEIVDLKQYQKVKSPFIFSSIFSIYLLLKNHSRAKFAKISLCKYLISYVFLAIT